MKNFQDTSLCPVIFKSISLLVLVLKKTFFFFNYCYHSLEPGFPEGIAIDSVFPVQQQAAAYLCPGWDSRV